ncbi:MAG: hypothetical protein ACKOEX_03375 [Planctomycetia bacterium]
MSGRLPRISCCGPSAARHSIVAVRPGDYRRLFARLRRGDG